MTNDKDKMTRQEVHEALLAKSDTKQVFAYFEQLNSFIDNRPTYEEIE